MPTSILLTFTALLTGLTGIFLSFMPELVLGWLGVEATPLWQLLLQVAGALYFGYGMLNWMVRRSPIGGIYNRPIAMANFAHFFVAGLAFAKGMTLLAEVPLVLRITSGLYWALALLFGMLLFRTPVRKAE